VTTAALAREDSDAPDYIDSCIGWLRGKADLGKDIVTDRPRPDFTLANQAGFKEGGRLSLMVWLPLGLMLLGIVALGGGIWVVRRR
jgi:hypothetical protein